MPTKFPRWAWWALAGTAAAFLMAADTPIPDRLALLRTLHPQARQRFLALFLAIEAAGWTVVLTSAKRNRALLDYHDAGLATDFNVVNKRTRQWLRSLDTKATWEASGVPAIVRRMGFRWGGDFVTAWKDLHGNWRPGFDPIHADLGTTFSLEAIRARATYLAGQAGTTLAHFDVLTMTLPNK